MNYMKNFTVLTYMKILGGKIRNLFIIYCKTSMGQFIMLFVIHIACKSSRRTNVKEITNPAN